MTVRFDPGGRRQTPHCIRRRSVTHAHDATTLLPLVSAYFERTVVEPFEVTQRVPRVELWPYLVNSIYGMDAIPAHEGEEILGDLSLPDPVPWTVAMIEVQGRA